MFVKDKSRRRDKRRVENSLKSMSTVTIPQDGLENREQFSRLKRGVRRSRRRAHRPGKH